LRTFQFQKKLHIERELVKFQEVVAFEMESNGAFKQAGANGYDLRVMERRPQADDRGTRWKIYPIHEALLFFFSLAFAHEASSSSRALATQYTP
jgi:hypothetical protein